MKSIAPIVVGLFAAVLLLSSCTSAPKVPLGVKADAIIKDDIVGRWEGDWGTMYLKAVGNGVRGIYTYEDGRVIGTFANGKFKGWWSESPDREPPDSAGVVEFTFLRSEGGGISLDGRWKYGDDPAEEWNEDWDLDWSGGDIPADIDADFVKDEDFPQY